MITVSANTRPTGCLRYAAILREIKSSSSDTRTSYTAIAAAPTRIAMSPVRTLSLTVAIIARAD